MVKKEKEDKRWKIPRTKRIYFEFPVKCKLEENKDDIKIIFPKSFSNFLINSGVNKSSKVMLGWKDTK